MSASVTASSSTADPVADHPPDALAEIARGVAANGESLSLILDLLKRVIQLLLPKAAGDGPTLSELLAAILAAQREQLLVVKSNATGIDEILQRLDVAGISLPQHQHQRQPNGADHP